MAVSRNAIVATLGTPQEIEGSLNEPREREEHGLRFNEKWIYRESGADPEGARARVIYWHRYEFLGTLFKPPTAAGASLDSEQWVHDERLAPLATENQERARELGRPNQALKHRAEDPLPELDPTRNPPEIPRRPYHPVSEVSGPADLGGRIE